jgi:catechol 2,3-dioxygenase-like lactoylglutathione lyase family enzyme
MQHAIKSIRPFIGARNFELSRNFYQDLGFTEVVLGAEMSLFTIQNFGFYLQNAYVPDWVDNTMLFLEVDDADRYFAELKALDLEEKYKGVRLVPVKTLPWGKECFLHDPSGVLWHFGAFSEIEN